MPDRKVRLQSGNGYLGRRLCGTGGAARMGEWLGMIDAQCVSSLGRVLWQA